MLMYHNLSERFRKIGVNPPNDLKKIIEANSKLDEASIWVLCKAKMDVAQKMGNRLKHPLQADSVTPASLGVKEETITTNQA